MRGRRNTKSVVLLLRVVLEVLHPGCEVRVVVVDQRRERAALLVPVLRVEHLVVDGERERAAGGPRRRRTL